MILFSIMRELYCSFYISLKISSSDFYLFVNNEILRDLSLLLSLLDDFCSEWSCYTEKCDILAFYFFSLSKTVISVTSAFYLFLFLLSLLIYLYVLNRLSIVLLYSSRSVSLSYLKASIYYVTLTYRLRTSNGKLVYVKD